MRSIELTVLTMMMPRVNDDHISIYIVLLRQHKACDSDETVLIPTYALPGGIDQDGLSAWGKCGLSHVSFARRPVLLPDVYYPASTRVVSTHMWRGSAKLVFVPFRNLSSVLVPGATNTSLLRTWTIYQAAHTFLRANLGLWIQIKYFNELKFTVHLSSESKLLKVFCLPRERSIDKWGWLKLSLKSEARSEIDWTQNSYQYWKVARRWLNF
jgi:hypothetical protein